MGQLGSNAKVDMARGGRPRGQERELRGVAEIPAVTVGVEHDSTGNCESLGRIANNKAIAPSDSQLPVESRSEEHTSELQSHLNLVCRLLLEKKKQTPQYLQPQDRR